ncbi:C2H2-type zinc finger [Carex littledalei]|uniref:C2H2-type zinc finger n=1 Tax=Carex littledalei TaxID=544730 RepID=A0A833VK23_9POAL|nr:C2H2-type zinc finger [Carex littledalei]
MEAPKGEEKFSCKLCKKSYPSGPALGGHMRCHYSDILNKKTKSAYGNQEPEDLTPESEVKDVALALIKLYDKLSSGKKELLEIDIPKSGAEEAAHKTLSLEMWHKNREKIQGTDPSLEEKEKIEQAAKPVSKLKFSKKRKMAETDISLTELKRTVYECNTCHRIFRSHQALGGHLSGRIRGRTCLKDDTDSMPVDARFNCDGYILKSSVVWAKQRRSVRVVISDLVNRN